MTEKPFLRKSLILGGVKSGKSRYAENLAHEHERCADAKVTFIATATAHDQEMEHRIARHKAERYQHWLLREEPLELAEALSRSDEPCRHAGCGGCIVIDCLTLWVTNLLMQSDSGLLRQEITDFQSAVQRCASRLIIVSNETNMGVTPLGELSRQYCDEIGLLHQRLGKDVDDVTLMVAGIPLVVKGKT